MSCEFVDEPIQETHQHDICISSFIIATTKPRAIRALVAMVGTGWGCVRAESVVRILPFLPHFWLSDVG
jgi:hypothetical protein